MPLLADIANALRVPYAFRRAGKQPIALAEDIRVGAATGPVDANSVEDWLGWLRDRARYRAVWLAADTYRAGDVVLRNGNLYLARATITDPTAVAPEADAHTWRLLTTWQGAYSAATAYAAGSVALHGGSPWCAIEPVLSSDPAPGRADNVKWVPASARSNADILALIADWAEEGGSRGIQWTKLILDTMTQGNEGHVLTSDPAIPLGYSYPKWKPPGRVPAWSAQDWPAGQLVTHDDLLWRATSDVDAVTQAEVDEDSSLTPDEKEPGAAGEWELVTTSWKGAWGNSAYKAGSIVVHRDHLFIARQDVPAGMSGPWGTTSHWKPISVFAGDWIGSGGPNYGAGLIVRHNGHTWLAIADIPAGVDAPGTHASWLRLDNMTPAEILGVVAQYSLWRGDWASGTDYTPGRLAVDGDEGVYICIAAPADNTVRPSADTDGWTRISNEDVEAWALTSGGTIPEARLPNSLVTHAEMEDFAENASQASVPDAKIPSGITRDSELDERISAEEAARIPGAPGSSDGSKFWGLNASRVPGWRTIAASLTDAERNRIPGATSSSTALYFWWCDQAGNPRWAALTGAVAKDALEALVGDYRVDASAIKNIPEQISAAERGRIPTATGEDDAHRFWQAGGDGVPGWRVLSGPQIRNMLHALTGNNQLHADFIQGIDGEQNVQADWNENNAASDAYIANRPTAAIDRIPPASPGTRKYWGTGGSTAPAWKDNPVPSMTLLSAGGQNVDLGDFGNFTVPRVDSSQDGLMSPDQAAKLAGLSPTSRRTTLKFAAQGASAGWQAASEGGDSFRGVGIGARVGFVEEDDSEGSDSFNESEAAFLGWQLMGTLPAGTVLPTSPNSARRWVYNHWPRSEALPALRTIRMYVAGGTLYRWADANAPALWLAVYESG